MTQSQNISGTNLITYETIDEFVMAMGNAKPSKVHISHNSNLPFYTLTASFEKGQTVHNYRLEYIPGQLEAAPYLEKLLDWMNKGNIPLASGTMKIAENTGEILQ